MIMKDNFVDQLLSLSRMKSQNQIIRARAIIPILFSSVTNTSKKIAFQTQNHLQNNDFLATVTNIGDINREEFLQLEGPVILILSTYGNGGSPADGQDFVEWLTHLQHNGLLEKMNYSIMGLGNRTFQHFAGNSRRIQECFIGLGATEITKTVFCDSSSEDQCANKLFPQWIEELTNNLKSRYEIKEFQKDQLLQKYKVTVQQGQPEKWQQNYEKGWKQNLTKQFINYWEWPEAKVLHIEELRKVDDGRSTLWIRIQTPPGMELQPACNVNIIPQNMRKPNEKAFEGYVKIEPLKKKTKIPFPPMALQKMWKLTNFSQFCDINTLKSALRESQANEQMKQKYKKYLLDPQQLERNPIRCQQIIQDLQPGLNFMVELGLNTVRPYTLASWEADKKYFDLVVSLDPKGLTSNYLKSRPKTLKVNYIQSSFYVPQDRPIVMIANGSGIAPFRSLVQRLMQVPAELRPQMFLYFGIQNRQNDYFFQQQWEKYQKEGALKINIAESRANPQEKVYVQNLVKQDKQFFKQHLFTNNGVIFICGSKGMANSVDTQIFQAIKLHIPIPFKAFKASKELIKNKTIVKEVFE